MKAKRADDAEAKLRESAIARYAGGVLVDPSDLHWSDEYADDNGWLDGDKIRQAAEALANAKPHMGRPRG